MESTLSCPSCGRALAPNAPQGLCKICLLENRFPTGTGTGDPKRAFVPPDKETLAPAFPELEILELIGQGGMGAVYKVRQKQLDRVVALKILPPGLGEEPDFAERFTREARSLAKLNHPSIVTLYEFGQRDQLFYFLMEFVDGLNLGRLLQGSPLAPKEALAIVPQICDALQYAHERGIVHRDIKPENILLSREGLVKIADFGVAKIVGSARELPAAGEPLNDSAEITKAGSTLGTPRYMAPEQLKNSADVDHRADIYSLGVVFYQMLTGELPSARMDSPSRRVAIDVRLDEVVLRALEKEPERRYQKAQELKERVETISHSSPAAERILRAQSPANPVARTALILSLVIVLPGIGFLASSLRSHPDVKASDENATTALPQDAENLAPPTQSTSQQGAAGDAARAQYAGFDSSGTASHGAAMKRPELDPATGLPAPFNREAPQLAKADAEPNLLHEVRSLIFNHEYEEALQRCLDFHAQPHAGSSLIPLLPEWVELGRRYPKAKQALIEIRDREAQEFKQGRGYFDLFMELSNINRELQDNDATVAVFKSIQEDRQLAQSCFGLVMPLLVKRGEYDLCLRYIEDPEKFLESYRLSWERLARIENQWASFRELQSERVQALRTTNSVLAGLPETPPPGPPRIAERNFIRDASQLIEALVGAGRKTEAQAIRDRALQVFDSVQLRSAVEEAERKISRALQTSDHWAISQL